MHLAILSASYSGSTVVNLIFGGLPDCYAIGESHWLSEVPLDNFFCNTCGGDCTILSRSVREKMCDDRTRWYDIAQDASGDSVIVSSEKDPNFYIDRQAPQKALILWKDPRAWLFSALKNDSNSADISIRSWCGLYQRIFKYLKKHNIEAKVVKLEHFASDPVSYMKRISDWAGLAFSEDALSRHGPFHYVGGNSMAQGIGRDEDHKKAFGNDIRPDYRWVDGLSEEMKQLVDTNARVASVVEMLEEAESHGDYALTP